MVYRAFEYDPTELVMHLPLQKSRRKQNNMHDRQHVYKDIVCAFDIETSLVRTGEHDVGTVKNPQIIEDYQAVMYIWQFQLGLDITIYGRTWEEFNTFINMLWKSLRENERIVIFIHSLAYEWQFIRDDSILGTMVNEDSVFCVKPRTPVKFLACADRLEFRCSYLHSNMHLEEYTRKMGVEHQKLSGDEFDYSKQRFPWTPMTDRELEYCFNDVRGLVECIYKEMELDHDNLYSLPLTSTGYVRRDMKKAIAKLPVGYVEKRLPDYSTYKMLREAFRGGNTHASRFYSCKRIDADIYCHDIASSYPNVLVNCKFPITPFREITKDALTIDHIMDLIVKGRAVLARVALWDVKLIDEFWSVPYLTKDKSRNIVNATYDNGRILRADYLEVTLTDIDIQIIAAEYDCEMVILDAMFAGYGYLPDEIRDVIRTYFNRKTALKGVEGEEVYYNKAKALLNACYGMMAQNPVKLDDVYHDHQYITGVKYKDSDGIEQFISELYAYDHEIDIYQIAHEHNILKSTLPYQWGVWCTAHARLALEEAIRICGKEFLYCDTDSVYYYGEHDFGEYNAQRTQRSRQNGACADDIKGETHYMGVLELDKTAAAFKTMGAKKYAYMDHAGELHITIAGVNKRKGAEELTSYALRHGMRDGLDAMQEGFVFQDAGGTESVYNDDPYGIMEMDGHQIYVPSNVAIKPSTYRTGLGDDYKTLLGYLLENDLFGLYELNYKGAQLPTIEC